MIMVDAQDLADKYVAVWNESNAQRRRQQIAALWVPDGQHYRYLAVSNESDAQRRRRQIAALWVPDGQHYVDVREARGYAALEQRIAGSHNKNVRDAGHHFRAAKDARMLRDIVIFHWEMLSAEDRAVAWGFQVLNVDDDGCILVDYQFVL
jgi:hypothetical protein